MPSFEAKTTNDKDPDQSTALENANGNPVARREAQMAVKAAHQALMGDEVVVVGDRNESIVEEKK